MSSNKASIPTGIRIHRNIGATKCSMSSTSNPFVWFVHVKLGFSGYGFSLDDDTADVGAGGAPKLQLTVTGAGGLNNTNEWTIQAPYGPVEKGSLTYSGPASETNGDTVNETIQPVLNPERT